MGVTKSTLAQMSFGLGCCGPVKCKIVRDLAGKGQRIFALLLTINEG